MVLLILRICFTNCFISEYWISESWKQIFSRKSLLCYEIFDIFGLGLPIDAAFSQLPLCLSSETEAEKVNGAKREKYGNAYRFWVPSKNHAKWIFSINAAFRLQLSDKLSFYQRLWIKKVLDALARCSESCYQHKVKSWLDSVSEKVIDEKKHLRSGNKSPSCIKMHMPNWTLPLVQSFDSCVPFPFMLNHYKILTLK